MADITKKRFAQLGQLLQAEQLAVAQRSAEGWRNGLGALTGLIGVIFFLKGRDNLADLPPGWLYAVTALLVSGFFCLVASTLLATGASFGDPGNSIWFSGDEVFKAVSRRVDSISRFLRFARLLSLVGVTLIVVALAGTWTHAEPTSATGASVIIEYRGDQGRHLCARSFKVKDGIVQVDVRYLGRATLSTSQVTSIRAVRSCS
ncbi:hypothetical protein [Streptomyces fuscichromogenes]|uniref:hypothetical protein n=1 Tax=Streptomyces fuscichromogenes TaxID=1324013 RepID=UPI001670084F|nr:hypothetical protein [Streptomyces fuscichromogenes]